MIDHNSQFTQLAFCSSDVTSLFTLNDHICSWPFLAKELFPEKWLIFFIKHIKIQTWGVYIMCSQQGNKGNRQTADPANQGSACWFTHLFRPVVSWTNEKQTEDPREAENDWTAGFWHGVNQRLERVCTVEQQNNRFLKDIWINLLFFFSWFTYMLSKGRINLEQILTFLLHCAQTHSLKTHLR